jgi:hypothetical protein
MLALRRHTALQTLPREAAGTDRSASDLHGQFYGMYSTSVLHRFLSSKWGTNSIGLIEKLGHA